jgi:hypothetical protein
MREGIEYEDTGLNYLIMYDSGDYSVVTEREIHLDSTDPERATVYHKNKPFGVEIIKKGTYERIKEKEVLFRNKLSVNTSEEEASKNLLRDRQHKSRLRAIESDEDDHDGDDDGSDHGDNEDFMGNDVCAPKTKKLKKDVSSASTSAAARAQELSSRSTTPSPLPSPPAPAQTPLPSPPASSSLSSNTTINAAIQEIQDQIARLNRANLPGANASRFVVTGIDGKTKNIVEEIFGKNFIKWMLAVAAFLFTEDEIMESILVPSNRTSRGHLDEDKVLLMRDALIFKYKFDHVQLDKAWSAVAKSINNKGRNIKLRRRTREIFTRMTTSVSRTFSANRLANEQ